jgi:hypothetical protein
MITRTVLCAVSLFLLLGCNRHEQPLVPPTDRAARGESQVSDDTSQPENSNPMNVGAAGATPAVSDAAVPSQGSEPPRPQSSDEPTVPSADAERPAKTETAPAKTDNAAAPPATEVGPAMDNAPSVPPAGDVAAPPSPAGVVEPQKATGQDAAGTDTRNVRFAGVSLTAPNGWIRRRPPLKFILAEFGLPAAEGDPSEAQLTVTRAVNEDPAGVDRLLEQLKEEEESQDSKIEQLTIANHKVVVVDSSGSYDDEEDSSAPSKTGERYRSLNAMVFLGGSVYFVNCTGPEKTVTEHLGEFRAFLETMAAAQ